MRLLKSVVLVAGFTLSGVTYALPALQLGPGDASGWTYYDTDNTGETTSNGTSNTWVYSGGNNLTLNAYANCLLDDAFCTNQNGKFAWDDAGKDTRYAYLTVATLPDLGNIDGFDITISNSGSTLSMVASGYGSPPVEDTNSLSSHSVFDTYFEIYEFKFDGYIGDIFDTQPGKTGTGKGYSESFDITINSLTPGVSGIHFDLFSLVGDGKYTPGMTADNQLVKTFAPYSHDGEWEPPTKVPAPATIALLGLGLVGISWNRRRKI